MSLHFFSIPAQQPGAAQAEFNAFCDAHRVAALDRQLVHDGAASFWALCVTVVDGPGPLPAGLKRAPRGAADADPAAAKPDYRQLLSEADFSVFAALRTWRKHQAESEAVPVYAVFTNEQLAEIARRRCATRQALAAIDGVGDARLQRYADAVLRCVAETGQAAGAAAAAASAPRPARPGEGA